MAFLLEEQQPKPTLTELLHDKFGIGFNMLSDVEDDTVVKSIRSRFENNFNANNWDKIPKEDKQNWEKTTSQFWLDTRIPVSKDKPDYEKLTKPEQTAMKKVFVGLTSLDTLQADDGVLSVLTDDIWDNFERAFQTKVMFDETVHNKSYSTIFQTLVTSSKEIDEIFNWASTNKQLQYKAKLIQYVYAKGNIYQKLIVDVLLESFLFYSGFYLPMLWLGTNKMMNVGEIIKLILRRQIAESKPL